MAQTIVQHYFEQGKIQGIEEGRIQGFEQGRIEAKQSNVLKALHLRFDTVPASLSGEIASIRSLPRLDALLEQAVTAKTLDEIDLQSLSG